MNFIESGIYHVCFSTGSVMGLPVKQGFYFAALSPTDALSMFLKYATTNLGEVPEEKDVTVEKISSTEVAVTKKNNLVSIVSE